MVNSVDGSNSLVYNTLCTYLPCLKPLIDLVTDVAYRFFHALWGPSERREDPTQQPDDLNRRKDLIYDVHQLSEITKGEDLTRDERLWEQRKTRHEEGLMNFFINLSGEEPPPAFLKVGGDPCLRATLPRRQMTKLPSPLKEHVQEFTEEQLTLQFVVYLAAKQETVQCDFTPLFQSAQKIKIGLFDAEGVDVIGEIPKNALEKKEINKKFQLKLTENTGTFYLGASYVECKTQRSRAYGIFGMIVSELDLCRYKTLQEFIDAQEPKIQEIFDPNWDY